MYNDCQSSPSGVVVSEGPGPAYTLGIEPQGFPVFTYVYVRTVFIMRTNLYFKIRKCKSTFLLSSTDKTRIVWM